MRKFSACLIFTFFFFITPPVWATDFKDYISGLTEDTSPTGACFLYELTEVGTARKVSVANLLLIKLPNAVENKILIGNSTPAWIVSPFTLAAPGAQYAVLSSDGTNWIRLATSANVTTMLNSANYAEIKALLDVDDLITLSGVAAGETNLSTFTGSTIPDSQTIKAALQALETALELKAPSISPSFTTPTLGVATATRIGVGQAADGTNPISSPGFYVDPDGDAVGKSFSTAKESGVAGQICAYTSSTTDLFGICWEGPDDHMTANYLLKLPDADPSTGQVMAFSAPSAGRSTISWVLPLADPGTAERGDIFYTGTSGTARLPHGVAGNPLISGGSAADPSYLAIVLAGGTNTFSITNGTAIVTALAGANTFGALTSSGFSGPLNGIVGGVTPAAGTFTTLTANAVSSLTLGSTTGPVKGSAIFWGATSGSSVLSAPDVAGSATAIVLPSAAGTLQLTTGTPAGFIIASQAIGDLLYASGTTAWSRLGIQAAGYILVGGTTPTWSNTPAIGAATGTSLAVTGILDGLATLYASGATQTVTAKTSYVVCTQNCTITLPAPAAGIQVCARNSNNGSYTITFAALGATKYYEKPDHTGLGTATTGTLAATAAITNSICLVAYDANTYYVWGTPIGTWTAN